MVDKLLIKDLKPGDRIIVFAIHTIDKYHTRKLAVFGILPGTEVEILQIHPVYVLRIGHTELALDKELAQNITFVRKK